MPNSPARHPFLVTNDGTLIFRTELVACHEHIDELRECLAELVGVYWGTGDHNEPPPLCIRRALAVLSEDVQ